VLFSYLYVTQVLRTRAGIDSHNISGTPGNKEVTTRLYSDLFRFREISDNILKMVQDRDIVAMED